MLNEARTKSYPENYPSDAMAILDAMSFSGGKDVKVLGSMSLRSQQYAGDYDAFEIVSRKGNVDKVLDDLASEFQSVIKNLRGMPNVFIGDIKAGSVEEWRVIPLEAGLVDGKIVGYNAVQSKAKIDELYKEKVITEGEKRSSEELLKDSPSPQEFLIARKKLKFHIIRWSVPEVLNGSKVERGKRITLQEAFSSPVITKLDTIGLVQNNRYTDFSIIYEFHCDGKTLNPSFEDIGQSLSEDIIFYKAENNPFKVLKREYALAKFRGDDKTLKSLTPVLNSDLGRIYSLLSDVGTLITLLEDKQNVPLDKVRYEIDQFKARMANVYSLPDFLKTEHTLLGHINSAMKTTSRPQLLSHLQQIEKLIQTSLTDNTKKLRGGRTMAISASAPPPPPPPRKGKKCDTPPTEAQKKLIGEYKKIKRQRDMMESNRVATIGMFGEEEWAGTVGEQRLNELNAQLELLENAMMNAPQLKRGCGKEEDVEGAGLCDWFNECINQKGLSSPNHAIREVAHQVVRRQSLARNQRLDPTGDKRIARMARRQREEAEANRRPVLRISRPLLSSPHSSPRISPQPSLSPNSSPSPNTGQPKYGNGKADAIVGDYKDWGAERGRERALAERSRLANKKLAIEKHSKLYTNAANAYYNEKNKKKDRKLSDAPVMKRAHLTGLSNNYMTELDWVQNNITQEEIDEDGLDINLKNNQFNKDIVNKERELRGWGYEGGAEIDIGNLPPRSNQSRSQAQKTSIANRLASELKNAAHFYAYRAPATSLGYRVIADELYKKAPTLQGQPPRELDAGHEGQTRVMMRRVVWGDTIPNVSPRTNTKQFSDVYDTEVAPEYDKAHFANPKMTHNELKKYVETVP
jgi:hypothetical protein